VALAFVTLRSATSASSCSSPGKAIKHPTTNVISSSGVPVHVVAARIGDRPETVLKTYAHLLPTSDAEAAEQVAALIG
jgi:predicted metal-dependent enzyme (double-stranded beta helix superfamily)